MKPKRKASPAGDLALLARRHGPVTRFAIGDAVTLNSGGPRLLVVDLGAGVTVATAEQEMTLPAECLTITESART